MEIEQCQPRFLAGLPFIDKGVARFFQRSGHCVTQIDQIAVVRQDLHSTVAVLGAGLFELINHLGRQRNGTPLTLVFGEQSECGNL